MTGPRWLVTGGGGLLGKAIVRVALDANPPPELVITSRRASGELFLDLDAPELVFPREIDVVVHVAGEKRDESRMEAVNHLGTRRLVEAAARSGVRRFVYVSSVGVYGAAPHSGVVRETFPHTPRNRYETTKDAGEICVVECCNRVGMEFLILQPSTVITRVPDSSYPLLTLMKMIRRGRFVWFGRGSPRVNYVSVDDVAAAVVAATCSAPSGSYIINTPALLGDVVEWISDELGVNKPHVILPMWIGQVAAAIGSATSPLAGPVIPLQRERFLELTNTTYYDPSLLIQKLSFEYPVGVEVLIRTLAQTYRQRGML
ncbi:MAG: NAD-dependent epimerase/dehydratase family protein [Gallionellaceae bacterium]